MFMRKKNDSKIDTAKAKSAAHADDHRGDAAAIERMLKQHPPLTDVQRAAFRSRFSDAQCDKDGLRTKSKAVMKDGRALVGAIASTLGKAHPELRYAPARFTWLLECMLALAKARARQDAAQGSVGAARKMGEQARLAALATREDLLEMLEELAGGVEADRLALAGARGTTKDDGDLAKSLRALGALASGWLARPGAQEKALVASSGLLQGHVDQAKAQADELDASSAEAQGGRLEPRDNAEVNRAEGRVVREIGVAIASFEAAHRKNKLVPRLLPGPAIRAALSKGRGAAEPATEATKQGAPEAAPVA